MLRQRRAVCGVVAAVALGLALPGAVVGASADVKSAVPAPPAPKTIVLFGARLRYYELGSGPTLVLVHGLGSSALGDWGAVIHPLAKTHRVLALDMLGFGGSDKPAIDYGVQTWVDFLGEFLREKRVREFTLMGESLGGWISARYTIQALQGIAADPAFMLPKPSRLVLCDAAGHRASWQAVVTPEATPPSAASNAPAAPIGASLAGQKRLMASIFRDPSYQSAAGIRGAFTWSLGKGDSQTIRSFVTNPQTLGETVDGQLGAITIPTLVVWGEHDGLIPLADGRAYADGIPGARLVVIPGAGHAPMIETPTAFLEALAGFR